MQGKPGWTCIVAAAAAAVCVCGSVRAQGAPDSAGKPAMMAKDADPDWDVVTVKPSDPNALGDRIDQHGRHLTFSNETVEMMLVIGYNVQKNQIASAPDWVKTERWEIDGLSNMDGQMNLPQLQTMVRKALQERFGLKLHRDQREMTVYAITVAKGRPKIKANLSDPDGSPQDNGGASRGGVSKNFKNTSMSDLALVLMFYTDRPVVDQTGLKGRYDFPLKWTTDEARTADPNAPPGLFTAIQEQDGLKLEPVKASAPVIVIDKIERPGAN